MAIDNYKNRGEVHIPDVPRDAGRRASRTNTSTTCWAASYRGSFRPLNDAIMSGRIRGVAAIVGCNNPRVTQDYLHIDVIKRTARRRRAGRRDRLRRDCRRQVRLLLGESRLDQVGPGLREVCETIGIPPVLHMGSCVDNTRILTVLTQMVEEGGLGDDIDRSSGRRPRARMDEREGAGHRHLLRRLRRLRHLRRSIARSDARPATATRLMTAGWEELYGGKMEFIADPDEMIRAPLEHIDKKRAALGLPGVRPEQVRRQRRQPSSPRSRSTWPTSRRGELGVETVGSPDYPLADGHSHDHGDGRSARSRTSRRRELCPDILQLVPSAAPSAGHRGRRML